MRAGPERVVLKRGSGFRLICLPFAGGSARSFVRLARCTPGDWQVTAVQPPAGFDAGAASLDALAYFYLGLLTEDLRGPGLVLGHSLGAAVAHRMTQLRPMDPSENLHLVLSAPPAPKVSSGELLAMDDRALLAAATRQGMLPDLRTSEDFALRFLIPHLRDDLAVLGRQGWVPEPVGAPVHLLGGSQDKASPPTALAALDVLVPRSTQLVEGGHMYVVEQPARTARALVDISRGVASRPLAEAARTAAT